MKDETDSLVQAWREIILYDDKSWVLFKNGTCVILMEAEDDLASQAIDIMKEWGPVHVGSPAGDFSVISPYEYSGWIVTCHHDDVLTYVSPDEVENGPSFDMIVGLFGRKKRAQDASSLEIIHVEDKRHSKKDINKR